MRDPKITINIKPKNVQQKPKITAIKDISDEEFLSIVKGSTSLRDIAKKIGTNSTVAIKRRVSKLDGEHVAHLLSSRSYIGMYDKVKLEELTKASTSWKDLAVRMGYSVNAGSIFPTLKVKIAEYGFDTSHFRQGELSDREFTRLSYDKRKKFIAENNNTCALCGLKDQWNNHSITMQVDHINGISHDHDPKNLRLLCPNCHSQQETTGRKNKAAKPQLTVDPAVFKIKPRCKCGQPKQEGAEKCEPCAIAYTANIATRPSIEELFDLVKNNSYRFVAKKYGVSDNSIRKWFSSKGFKAPHMEDFRNNVTLEGLKIKN